VANEIVSSIETSRLEAVRTNEEIKKILEIPKRPLERLAFLNRQFISRQLQMNIRNPADAGSMSSSSRWGSASLCHSGLALAK